ncbi:MAG: major capsid protein [Carnobacterium sp.]|uniref:major capsid protein n=1 Tax=Carnobacterium sp. TaxID=48221 RepID=UPI002FCBB8AD
MENQIEQRFEAEAKKQGFQLTTAQKRVAVIAFTAVSAMPAFAADGFDVSSIVTIITGFVAGVSALGLAVLSLVVTGKVFKWVRTAL